ncbi:hypothetical protein GGS20DRAFT_531789 [Poronia punctata]|nr:hypothetical protein GGS20DRAFT_531789 [Poronia punctata]
MLPSTPSSSSVDGSIPRSIDRVPIPVHIHTPTLIPVAPGQRSTVASAPILAPAHTSAVSSGINAPVSNPTSRTAETGFPRLEPAGPTATTAATSSTTGPRSSGRTGPGNETGSGIGAGTEYQPSPESLPAHPNPPSSVASASAAASPNVYKRGPSLSLDGDLPSPESTTSQPASRDNGSSLPPDQRNKKRRTGPGSRGVANLTPEQLAKKRANDREAQRAIRERTKNQIESLENRIRELTSQQPYQELQKVVRQKEAVEAENAELKNRMASIVAMLQPIISNHPMTGSVEPSPVRIFGPTQLQSSQQRQPETQAPRQPSVYPAHSNPATVGATSPVRDAGSPWSAQSSIPSNSYPQQTSHQMDPQNKVPNQRHDRRTQDSYLGGGEQHRLSFLLDPSQRIHRMQTGINGAQDSPEYHHLPMKHDWSAHIRTNQHNNMNPAGLPVLPQQQAQQAHRRQEQGLPQRVQYAHDPSNPALSYFVGVDNLVKHSEPTCPLDGVLLDFLQERRQRVAEGVPPQEIVGPRYPSISSLLNPANSIYAHPLSKVFTDILTTFPAISRLPERIAVLYVMFMIMRWQISPTEENYDLTPPFARPVPAQFSIPHPVWIDHLPFPAMREKLVHEYNPTHYLFDNFFIPYTTTLSLNWPYDDTDTLLESPDGEIIINPVFRRHMCRAENWTLGPAFDVAFPSLRGTYNLKSDVPTPPNGDPGLVRD